MRYLGDLSEDQEITFLWNTTDASGASVTRTTDGAIKVRRDDGTDCTGTSVSDNEDTPDTGVHECVVNTSDGANYVVAHDYSVWLDGAVIDGQTVNACLAQFSIENRFSDTQDVIVANKLDHLVAVADSDDVADSSIIAKLAASDGDWSGFSAATDSLEAVRDQGDGAWITATSVDLNADAITASVFDESTAFPLVASDSGATQVARVGADGDTLETLSDQIDGTSTHDAAGVKTAIEAGGGSIALILADTNELQTNQGDWLTATSVTVSDKTGFVLAATGLDAVATTAPAGVASTFREMVVQLWRRWFKRTNLTKTGAGTGTEKTYADNDVDVLTTHAVTDDGEVQTREAAS
uniref:Uncharacterized protein n=1 Tax=viral metagenome TaxID=1070528 RepID=A0A6M3INK0_9ZZZZ